MMRVLTVRQPWAGSILHHGKTPENRSRNIAGEYRGPVAIHVSQRHDYEAQNGPHAEILGFIDQHHTYGWGHVIGVVELVSVHHADDFTTCIDVEHGMTDDGSYLSCSPWAIEDHWHLCLANPRPIDPIPAKGRLGLWRPDADLEAKIEEALR